MINPSARARKKAQKAARRRREIARRRRLVIIGKRISIITQRCASQQIIPPQLTDESALRMLNNAIVAPSNFCFCENTKECGKFFEDLIQRLSVEKSIAIDLGKVDKISVDTILLLYSSVNNRKFNRNGCRLYQKREVKEHIHKVLYRCGFYNLVNLHLPKGMVQQNGWKMRTGTFLMDGGNSCKQKQVDQLSSQVSKMVHGPRGRNIQAIGSIFKELIDNTVQHADEGSWEENVRRNRSQEKWYVMADQDEDTGVCKIAFIDFGVGIAKSLQMKGFPGFVSLFTGNPIQITTQMTELFMNGASRTGSPGRGCGLMTVHLEVFHNKVRSMRLFTGDVIGDVKTRKFVSLSRFGLNQRIPGTLYYLEVDTNTL